MLWRTKSGKCGPAICRGASPSEVVVRRRAGNGDGARRPEEWLQSDPVKMVGRSRVGAVPEDPIPPSQTWPTHRPLEDPGLMAERHVLQGDRRRPEEHGAEEGPETQHENHRGPPASGMASGSRPYRMSGGDGDESSGVTSRDGVIDRDTPSPALDRSGPCRAGCRALDSDHPGKAPAGLTAGSGSGERNRLWTA